MERLDVEREGADLVVDELQLRGAQGVDGCGAGAGLGAALGFEEGRGVEHDRVRRGLDEELEAAIVVAFNRHPLVAGVEALDDGAVGAHHEALAGEAGSADGAEVDGGLDVGVAVVARHLAAEAHPCGAPGRTPLVADGGGLIGEAEGFVDGDGFALSDSAGRGGVASGVVGVGEGGEGYFEVCDLLCAG